MPDVKLETPSNYDELYLARGTDIAVFRFRPAFTGDVFRMGERLVALVQHPCAIRKGTDLADRRLVTEVATNQGGIPADWASGSFKRMFLPELLADSLVISFDQPDVVQRGQIESAERVAILSSLGVDLLVQRWIHHNSRVVIPTITINALSIGPFDEADLLCDASSELTAAGMGLPEATQRLDRWFSEPDAAGGVSRREMLANAHRRSAVRAALRRQVKEWAE